MGSDLGASIQPSVSIVVAVRGAVDSVGRCLDSVIGQHDAAVQLVVIDGGSIDGTVDVIDERADHIDYWVSEPDSGVYSAWNKALGHVAGDWVLFLGSDDELAASDTLAIASQGLDAANEQRVVYGSIDVIAEEGSVERTMGEPWDTAGPRFREEMSIPHTGTFHHRSLFEEHGRFNENYRIAADYEFLLRELLDHDAMFIPDLTITRMAAGGISDNPATMARHVRENHRARYEHGLVDTPDWRSFEVLRATTHARLTQMFGRGTADRVGDLYRGVTRSGKKSP